MIKRILFLLCFLVFNANAKGLPQLKSVNFFQEGEVSKLVLDFSNVVSAERNHIKNDKQIILDIKNVNADKKFLRGIDTSEFSGSAVFVSPYIKPGSKNDLRFAIQLRDNVRSFVENKGTRVILHVENRFGVFTRSKLKKVKQGEFTSKSGSEAKNISVPKSNSLEDILENLTQSGVKRYVGRKISLNVNNVEYKEVLKMIGDTSGFNIIIEDEVGSLKPLTISLTNLPWDQVLDTVMDLGGLVALKFGNILTITTAEKARKAREEEIDAQEETKNLEPLVTKFFPLSYSELEDMQKLITPYITEKRGSVQIDKRTQHLIVIDTVEVIERIKKIIEILDTQTPQILIEGKIVEVSESYELNLGLQQGLQLEKNTIVSRSIDANGDTFTLNSISKTTTAGAFMEASINVAKLVNLNFALNLMESESKGKVVTSPKVITESNKEAKIIQTLERKFTVPDGVSNEGTPLQKIEPISAVIDLSVTPKVTNDGSVTMKLKLSKDTLVEDLVGATPSKNNRQVETNVLVDNGSTAVIGGIYQNTTSEVSQGIPFLQDLPLVGWLFRSSYNPKKDRTELMVFITPRIINQESAGLGKDELGDDLGL